MKTVETEIKYAGYLEQQKRSMAKLKRDEERVIPAEFDYAACSGLSREMIEKLGKVRLSRTSLGPKASPNPGGDSSSGEFGELLH